MKYNLLVLFCIVLSHGSAQYTYFDFLKQTDEVNEHYRDVYVTDSSIVTAAIRNSIGDTSIQILREYTFEGEITNEQTFNPAIPANYSIGGHQNTLNALPNDSGYYMCGAAALNVPLSPYLIRYNSNLDSAWTKVFYISDFNKSGFSAYYPIEDHLIVCHYFRESPILQNGGGTDLIKLTAEGDIVWIQPIKSPEPAYLYSNQKINKSEDGYLLGGQLIHHLNPGGEWATWVTKTNNEGEILWEYSEIDDFDDIEDTFPDYFRKAIELSNGQVAMVSQKGYDYWEVYPSGEWHYNKVFIRFLDGDTGELMEVREYLSDYEMLYGGVADMFETSDGGLIILGASRSINEDPNLTGLTFPWLMKLDNQGNQEWYKEYYHQIAYEDYLTQGMSGYFWDMERTPDGGYVMSGQMDFLLSYNEQHSWLLKVDGCGEEEWSDCESPVGVELVGFANDGFTISPNPATDMITIQTKKDGTVDEVLVYDLQGKLVLQQSLRNSSSEINMDISSLSPGLFVVQVINHDTGRIFSKKLVVN